MSRARIIIAIAAMLSLSLVLAIVAMAYWEARERSEGLLSFRELVGNAETIHLRYVGYSSLNGDVSSCDVSIGESRDSILSAMTITKGPWRSDGLLPACSQMIECELTSIRGEKQEFDILNGNTIRFWNGNREYTATLADSKLEAILLRLCTEQQSVP